MADPWAAFRTAPADPWAAFRQEPMPTPPPGEIIHNADGTSTVAGTGLTATRPEDPQQAAVALEALKQRAAGRDLGGMRGAAPVLQGLSFNFGDEAVSAAAAAARALKGGKFANEYAIAQEIQKQELERERAEHPYRSMAGEIGGGLTTGLGAFGAGATAARFIPQAATGATRFGATMGAGAADAAAYGALSGAGAQEGADRAIGAAIGGGVGAGVGAALPIAGRAVSSVAAPLTARLMPETVSNAKLLQYHRRAGMTPQDVSTELQAAAAEGQPMFTVADALGNAGQRAIAGVGRIPHEERQALVDFLNQRQAGQSRRVSNALAEGFNAPVTAQRGEELLTAARDRAADAAYGAARQNAGPVDLTGTIARIDATLQPGLTALARPQSNIANDSVEAALQGIRNRLTDNRSTLTDFTAIQRVRGDLSDAIQAAQRAGRGNQARLLGGVLRELDTAMENASTGFRQANRDFAAGSRAIEAVGEGRTAATRGRVEDTIPAFQGMTPIQQAGFRVGYADPLIERAQGSAFGVNTARPLTSQAFQQEANAFAPGAPMMGRRLGRENTMFGTREAALGGSRTADNLADAADVTRADPAILANLLTGHFGAAARAGGNRLLSEMSGVSPGVAERLTQRLLETDGGRALANIVAAENSINRHDAARQLALRLLLSGGAAGATSQ